MNRNYRNIGLVAFFSIFGGWIGIWLNNVTGNTAPPMQSLGALFWLTSPALTGIVLRAFGGDGWGDAGFWLHIKSSWKWYIIAILVYPVIALLVSGIALLTGSMTVEGFYMQGFSAYLALVTFMLGASFMKNIFEEFAWRGYFSQRLEAAKIHPLINHAIVGVIWWSWHLPYYYYFLDRQQFANFLGKTSPIAFIALALFSTFPTAVLFGELRLISKSVWTVFILHEVINALSMPLLLNGFISLQGIPGTIFSPTNDGILTSILFGAAGLMIYNYRLKNSKKV